MGIREGGCQIFYRFKGGRDQISLRTTALAERMRLNGQIHAKMCQNAALSDYSRKPSSAM